jgi:hypothetical protein
MSNGMAAQNGVGAGEQQAENAESALARVSTLMQERRKYEGWLESLDARRDSTPARVFSRVHADYSARLDIVLGELSTHSGGLRAELGSLTSRLTSLEEEQQSYLDERAEAELRAHVGELSPDAWKEIAESADRQIEELTGKQTELERELSRTRELLNEAERPPTPRSGTAVPAQSQRSAVVEPPVAAAAPIVSAPVVAAPAVSSANEITAPRASGSVRQSETESVLERRAPSGTGDETMRAERVAAPGASELPTELTPAVIAAEAQLVEKEAPAEVQAERGDADVTPAPTQRADTNRKSAQKTGTFDELAFLSSVVDTPTGTADVPAPAERGDERARRDSFAQRGADDDIVNLASGSGTLLEGAPAARNVPLAMNVTGNTPIVIKEKTAEAAKSLKCGECGSMNYPTEWYCERCGAELASL